MWFPGTRRDNCIGIDIGLLIPLRFVVCPNVRMKFFWTVSGLANLPPSSIVNGTIKEPQLIAETLKSLSSILRTKIEKNRFRHFGLFGHHKKNQPAGHPGKKNCPWSLNTKPSNIFLLTSEKSIWIFKSWVLSKIIMIPWPSFGGCRKSRP